MKIHEWFVGKTIAIYLLIQSIPLILFFDLSKNFHTFFFSIFFESVVIVAVVVQDPNTKKYLMIQENKPECRGQWYLPAGRLENFESLTRASLRECLEETGMRVRLRGIFNVEFFPYKTQNFIWTRYGIAADLINPEEISNIKTKDRADKESICAQYFSWEELNQMAKENKIRAL